MSSGNVQQQHNIQYNPHTINGTQETQVVTENGEQETTRIVLILLVRKQVHIRSPTLSSRKAREHTTTN